MAPMSSPSFERILTNIIVATGALVVGIGLLNVHDVIALHLKLLGGTLQKIEQWSQGRTKPLTQVA